MIVQDCCFRVTSDERKACWTLTDKCNLACRYCAANSNLSRVEISFPLTGTRCDEVAGHCQEAGIRKIVLSGGEPLIISNISEIVYRLNKRGMRVSVCTNGTLLSSEVLARLANAGLSKVLIGIDCSRMFDQSRQCASAYSTQISQALHLVRRWRLGCEVNFVLLPSLKQRLESIAIWTREHEPFSVSLIAPQNCGRFATHICQTPDWGYHQMLAVATGFETLVAPISTVFVSPRCQQDDCPSERLVFGILPEGTLTECPWKRYLRISSWDKGGVYGNRESVADESRQLATPTTKIS